MSRKTKAYWMHWLWKLSENVTESALTKLHWVESCIYFCAFHRTESRLKPIKKPHYHCHLEISSSVWGTINIMCLSLNLSKAHSPWFYLWIHHQLYAIISVIEEECRIKISTPKWRKTVFLHFSFLTPRS